MRLSMGTELRQVQKQVLSPTMIQRMEILQLPVMALQQRIEQEMNENPLLEVPEETEITEAEVGENLDEPETVNDQEEELVVEDNSDNAADFRADWLAALGEGVVVQAPWHVPGDRTDRLR